MKILYFAWLKSKVNIGEETISLPDGVTTVNHLINWLKTRSEGHANAFADLSVVRVAVNQEHVQLDAPLFGTEEVAFFPPVTGG